MRKYIIALLIFFGLYSTACGAQIGIEWTPNSEPDIAGYKIHYGHEYGVYGTVVDTESVATSYLLDNLPAGRYYVCLTAYDTRGNESDYSYVVVVELKIDTVKRLVINP